MNNPAESLAPTANDVIRAYHVMLGRPPESDVTIHFHLALATSRAEVVRGIAQSLEFQERIGASAQRDSPFFHFAASIDVEALVRRHVDPRRVAVPGHLVNFLGVKIPTRVMSLLKDRGGELDVIPVPANFHADMSEWAAALHAVELAGPRFAMIELGCGWGCWMNNTGVAARSLGKKLDLIGIEGDSLHIDFAIDTFRANGIGPQAYTLLRGIAAADTGYALFPSRKGDDERWGCAPRFGVSAEEVDTAVSSGEFDCLEMISLEKAIGHRQRIDLLHMDIQGGEAEFVAKSISVLSDRVAYLVIGTHTRQIEGLLLDTLLDAGWQLEVERPAIVQLVGGVPQTTVDGVQGWRNPRLFG